MFIINIRFRTSFLMTRYNFLRKTVSNNAVKYFHHQLYMHMYVSTSVRVIYRTLCYGDVLKSIYHTKKTFIIWDEKVENRMEDTNL